MEGLETEVVGLHQGGGQRGGYSRERERIDASRGAGGGFEK